MNRLSQNEVRQRLNYPDERIVKYIYDGYTFKHGIRPIRKKKTRDRVKREFYEAGFDKDFAKEIVENIL